MVDNNSLRKALKDFIAAQGLEDSVRILKDNQEILLTWDAEYALVLMTKEFIIRAGEDAPEARHMQMRCNMLSTACKIGIQDIQKVTKEIIDLINGFVLAPTWGKCKEIIETDQDVFFSNHAEAAFLFMIQQSSSNEDMVHEYKSHHELLKSCHLLGIEKAFAEVDRKACAFYFSRSVFDATFDFTNAPTMKEKKQIVEKEKDLLLTDDGEEALNQLIDHNRENTQILKELKEALDLLVCCRRQGIDAAFMSK